MDERSKWCGSIKVGKTWFGRRSEEVWRWRGRAESELCGRVSRGIMGWEGK